jgi:hypothetical protein
VLAAVALAALVLGGWLLPKVSRAATPPAVPEVVLELYSREGCPRCRAAKSFLDDLSKQRRNLRIVEHRIDADRGARQRLEDLFRQRGIALGGVPTFVVGGKVLVGFEDARTTGGQIRALVDAALPAEAAAGTTLPPGACGIDADEPCEEARHGVGTEESAVDSKLFGRVSVSRLGLPLFTVALGLLDGFNPCATWVLLFLLAMLAGQRDRKRMAVTAGTFVIASGVVYYAFMAAWLNLFLVIGMSSAVQRVLGLVAVAIGALNTKDFFAFKRGLTLSIPERAKPSIYARVRQVLRAETLLASSVGVAVLAVLVNLVELLCTAGFPAMYTSVLARAELSPWARAGYLGLYNLAYLADDALMVTIAVVTLSRRRLSEYGGRWLKLLSGVVMLALGLILLFVPEWLA